MKRPREYIVIDDDGVVAPDEDAPRFTSVDPSYQLGGFYMGNQSGSQGGFAPLDPFGFVGSPQLNSHGYCNDYNNSYKRARFQPGLVHLPFTFRSAVSSVLVHSSWSCLVSSPANLPKMCKYSSGGKKKYQIFSNPNWSSCNFTLTLFARNSSW